MILRLTFFERLLHRFHLFPTPVMDAFAGIVFGRALTIAVRKGLFEAVAARPLSVQEIARHVHLSAEGVHLLAEAFTIGGYLRRAGEKYIVSAEGKKWLLKSSPSYLGHLVNYFETLYSRWGSLEYSLEHGRPMKPYYDMFGDKEWETYVYGMRDLARLLMPEVVNKVALPGSPKHLLDVGGSHGLYAIECCRRYPGLQAVVMDFEPALRHTATVVQEAGMQGRVQLVAGDFTSRSLPEDQDAVLIFNVIHGFDEAGNRELVRRSLHSLKPGGKLYILDQMVEDRRRSTLEQFMPVMVGLNLLNEIGGSTFSFEQVRSWCAGVLSVKRMRLRLPGVTLVEATR